MTRHIDPILLAGEWTRTGTSIEVRAPFDGRLIAEVATTDDAGARHCTERAARWWREEHLDPHERADILERARLLLLERRHEMSADISAEAGKPVRLALAEVDRAADTLAASAVVARSSGGEVIPVAGYASGTGRTAFTIRRARGVVVAITPFNFPLNLVCHKVAPAIAAGAPVVLKPAERTPLSALRLAAILEEAGLPPGFLSVIVGDPAELVPAATDHEDVQVLSFTGSASVGRALEAANPHRRVLLELGSAAPAVVLSGADVADAADRIAVGAFAFAGQSCVSVQRVLVHEELEEALIAHLRRAVDHLIVGDPQDAAVTVGPVIDPSARDRLAGWVANAVEGGAERVIGGEKWGRAGLNPTIVREVPVDVPLWCEEAFGPVLAIRTFRDIDRAVAAANVGPAIQVGVFGARARDTLRLARALRFGGIVFDDVPTFRADAQPYGGWRDGGNTREGPAWTVDEYTEASVVILPG